MASPGFDTPQGPNLAWANPIYRGTVIAEVNKRQVEIVQRDDQSSKAELDTDATFEGTVDSFCQPVDIRYIMVPQQFVTWLSSMRGLVIPEVRRAMSCVVMRLATLFTGNQTRNPLRLVGAMKIAGG